MKVYSLYESSSSLLSPRLLISILPVVRGSLHNTLHLICSAIPLNIGKETHKTPFFDWILIWLRVKSYDIFLCGDEHLSIPVPIAGRLSLLMNTCSGIS